MKSRDLKKLKAITPSALIVGVDIAKELHWARFIDYRGLELRKPLKFQNDKNGLESILASIQTICKDKKLANVIVGMEPTGHYWEPLANYLIMHGITVVMVNPYHKKICSSSRSSSKSPPGNLIKTIYEIICYT